LNSFDNALHVKNVQRKSRFLVTVENDDSTLSAQNNSTQAIRNETVQHHVNGNNSIRSVCSNSHLNSIKSFNAFIGNFNFFHVNVQGILDATHLDELKLLCVKSKNVSLVAISETFLRASNTNKSIQIDGFKVIRSDRSARVGDRNKGGGVAIYLKTNLRHKIILNSSKCNNNIVNVEFLFLEIFTRSSKIIFGVVYRAPKCSANDSRAFFDLVTATVSGFKNVIIVGDFNINFLHDKINSSLMNNFAVMFSLVNDSCPTHYWPGKMSSQIDLIFTNNISKIPFSIKYFIS